MALAAHIRKTPNLVGTGSSSGSGVSVPAFFARTHTSACFSTRASAPSRAGRPSAASFGWASSSPRRWADAQHLAVASIFFGRQGAVIQAMSGIEIALWDIVGKATRRPVYQLLGGGFRTKFRAYASILFGKDGKNVWKLKEDCEFTTKKGKKVTMHKGHWVGPKICEQCVKGDWSLIGKAKSKGEKAKDKE